MRVKTVLENQAPPAPSKPPAPPAYQRNPGSAGRWLDRASADFALAGKVEALSRTSDNMLASLVRADSPGYENLAGALENLITRHASLVAGARVLHGRIAAALAGGGE